MGILTGQVGIMLGSMNKLNANNTIMRLNIEVSRVQKDIGRMEAQINRSSQNTEMMLRTQLQQSLARIAQKPGGGIQGHSMYDPSSSSVFTNSFAQLQQEAQLEFSNAQAAWRRYYDDMRLAQLEPLKNKEMDLKLELNNAKAAAEVNGVVEQTGSQIFKSGLNDFKAQG